MSDRVGVIFVCLGNICRSPLGEGIFRHLVRGAGLDHRFEIASAGTSSYHVGEPPDPGSVRVARKNGIDISAQRSQQFRRDDADSWDYIIAMDASNHRNILRMASGDPSRLDGKLWLMRNFEDSPDGAGHNANVPDPWGGGRHGFETVFSIVRRSCENLLAHIRSHHGL